MNFYSFEINGKEYKLILTTQSLCQLEDKIGRNPLEILMQAADNKLPKTKDMVLILWASLQKFHHNMNLTECYNLFDEYIHDGHSYIDFIAVAVDIFKISGVIKEVAEEEDNEKN